MLGQLDIIKNIYASIQTYRNTFPREDRQILDPLTTMIKLAILGYKPYGTKLAIDKNRIYFQEPTILQGFWRWAYGNKRYELHHLLNPIMKAVKRYDKTKTNIKLIFDQSIYGLQTLKSSYNDSSSVVTHSLDLYISIINNTAHLQSTELTDVETETQYSIFRELWTEDEIQLVSSMIEQIKNSNNQPNTTTYLEAVNTILSMKEERANELLRDLTQRL
jgi:hypothetical protein